MELLGSEGSKKEKNDENMPQLEITEVLLLYFRFVNNQYQRSSRLLCSFVPNKSIGQLLIISPTNDISPVTFNSAFSYIEIWYTDQNAVPRDIKYRIHLTLVINDKGI